MRRKVKNKNIMGYQTVLQHGLKRLEREMRRRGCLEKSIRDDIKRIKNFIMSYTPDDWYWCKFTYDNYMFCLQSFLSCQVKGSNGYKRRMKSLFNRFTACLLPYQLELFEGVL